MTFPILYVAIVLVFMLVALMRESLRPGLVLFTAVVLLLIAGIITPEEAIKGFSNKGMITVALLYLISEGVRKSGILERIVFHMLPKKNATILSAGLRFYPVVSLISAFFNNTPVVIIFAPMIKNWAHKMKLPPAKFLIPLSYATIIGGFCTLIGTTTNLVLHGMLIQEHKDEVAAAANATFLAVKHVPSYIGRNPHAVRHRGYVDVRTDKGWCHHCLRRARLPHFLLEVPASRQPHVRG